MLTTIPRVLTFNSVLCLTDPWPYWTALPINTECWFKVQLGCGKGVIGIWLDRRWVQWSAGSADNSFISVIQRSQRLDDYANFQWQELVGITPGTRWMLEDVKGVQTRTVWMTKQWLLENVTKEHFGSRRESLLYCHEEAISLASWPWESPQGDGHLSVNFHFFLMRVLHAWNSPRQEG